MAKTKTPTSQTRYNPVNRDQPWSPGLARTPWMALGALILTIASIATSIGILAGSDNKPISDWRYQPTVYLAIATTIANICLHYAFSQGVTIAWWRTALQGTSLGELHRTYQFGNDFWAATLGLRYLSLVSIACLLVTISPINGPLMQRASQVTSRGSAVRSTLKLNIAESLPVGYTAYTTTRDLIPSMMTPEFAPLLQRWTLQTPIPMKNACRGTCSGRLKGAGFALNCTKSTVSFNTTIPHNATVDQYNPGSQYFGIAVGTVYGMPYESQTVSVVFKNTTECSGVLYIQNCTMRPAIVDYPVVVDGSGQTIALQGASTIFDDVVVSVRAAQTLGTGFGRDTYGGLYKALSDRFTSSAAYSNDPVIDGDLEATGFAANQYGVSTNQNGALVGVSCAISYSNPLPDVLQAARDLSFRTAVNAANSSTSQTIVVSEISNEPHFQSNYVFLGLALLATLLPVLLVATVFHGFWRIGRKVSLSPIEVAKAFDAPGLRSKDSNATAGALVKEIGDRLVMYGGTAVDDEIPEGAEGGPRLRLQMKSPETVLEPIRGWRFVG